MKWKFVFVIFLQHSWTFCQETRFEHEYTYQASEHDSKVSSRIKAIEQVKLLAAFQVVTYVFSKSEISNTEDEKNFKSSYREEMLNLTTATMRLNVIEEKWDGVSFYLKAEVFIDKAKAVNRLDELLREYFRLKERPEDIDKRDLIQKAWASFRIKEYGKAKAYLRPVIASDPSDFESNMILGDIAAALAEDESQRKAKQLVYLGVPKIL